ncbi:SMP-30/gluconolactonase/LRE family protein [Pedobacter sp. Leaf132]|uniref:SMP-30/gluconolactonase/LRE family protein n=1 Tax=Pedobacter sp. Leaf132 TaxID=2876557 RepID=UPI001E37857A|nr:SMP-30/gluconolactonase/LRE family protein [Pedobacter sp. Leaf132]
MKYPKSKITLPFSLLCILLFLFNALKAGAQLFSQDSLKLISRQFSFTEAPSVNPAGYIFFTDQPNNQIWKYDLNGKLSLFMDNAGRANGTYINRNGQLLICADENNELWSVDKNKKIKILLCTIDGKKPNGPNDLWADKFGGIYFTDPYYQRNYWSRQKPEIEGQKVYYLPPGRHHKARVAAEEVSKPNGIVSSSDGRYLYVSDIGGAKIYCYSIGKKGMLYGQKLFVNHRADGITLDEQGNLYLAADGVTIFNSKGIKIGQIVIKESWTSNVCFGGKNHNELFITASTAIYTIPIRVSGIE